MAKSRRQRFPLIVGLATALVLLVVAFHACTSFLSTGMRSKRSEAPTNLNAIRHAELAYFRECDRFITMPSCPESEPERQAVGWSEECVAQWIQLGWVPEGFTRCRYGVVAQNKGNKDQSDFVASATCDIDGDGKFSVYEASRADKARLTTKQSEY